MGKSLAMTTEEINEFLGTASVGRLATLDAAGYPYVLAVNFVYWQNKIYIHGKGKGQKIANLTRHNQVGFEIDELYRFMDKELEMPCDIYANYRSVVIKGQAALLSDQSAKRAVLDAFVAKYLPHMVNAAIPDEVVKITAVIEIEISELFGKKHV